MKPSAKDENILKEGLEKDADKQDNMHQLPY
jgi:hypothetical protein